MEKFGECVSEDPIKFVDSIGSAVLVTDLERNTVFGNKAFHKLFGTDPERIKNKKCWELMHPNAKDCLGCPGGIQHFLETKIKGKPHNLVISGFSLYDHIFRIIQDISQALREISTLRRDVEDLQKKIDGIFGNGTFVIICCVCHRVRTATGTWVASANPEILKSAGGISHGYCPECAQKFIERNFGPQP